MKRIFTVFVILTLAAVARADDIKTLIQQLRVIQNESNAKQLELIDRIEKAANGETTPDPTPDPEPEPTPDPGPFKLRPHGERFINHDTVDDLLAKLKWSPKFIPAVVKAAEGADDTQSVKMVCCGLLSQLGQLGVEFPEANKPVAFYTSEACRLLLSQIKYGKPADKMDDIAFHGLQIALVYDWVYDDLSPADREVITLQMSRWAIADPSNSHYYSGNWFSGEWLHVAVALADDANDPLLTAYRDVCVSDKTYSFGWAAKAYPQGGCFEGVTYSVRWIGNHMTRPLWRIATDGNTDFDNVPALSQIPQLMWFSSEWSTINGRDNSRRYTSTIFDFGGYNDRYWRNFACLTADPNPETAALAAHLCVNANKWTLTPTDPLDVVILCLLGDPRTVPGIPSNLDFEALQSSIVYLHRSTIPNDTYVAFQGSRSRVRALPCAEVAIYSKGVAVTCRRSAMWAHEYADIGSVNTVCLKGVDESSKAFLVTPRGGNSSPEPVLWGPMVKNADGSYSIEYDSEYFSGDKRVSLWRRTVRFDKPANTVAVTDRIECDPALQPVVMWQTPWETLKAGQLPTLVPLLIGSSATIPGRATIKIDRGSLKFVGGANWNVNPIGDPIGNASNSSETQQAVNAGLLYPGGRLEVYPDRGLDGAFDVTTVFTIQGAQ